MRQDYIYLGMFLIMMGLYMGFIYTPVQGEFPALQRYSIAEVNAGCGGDFATKAKFESLIRNCTPYEVAYWTLILAVAMGGVIFFLGSIKPSRYPRQNKKKSEGQTQKS
ncbi:MAG: hypothetical protein ACE5HH_03485 [Candidatus Hydrothermarchaeales archaeon]